MAYAQNAVIGGRELKDAFSAASQCLDQHRDALNALNVFPVPDGDTGTNMLLTLRAAVENAPGVAGRRRRRCLRGCYPSGRRGILGSPG